MKKSEYSIKAELFKTSFWYKVTFYIPMFCAIFSIEYISEALKDGGLK